MATSWLSAGIGAGQVTSSRIGYDIRDRLLSYPELRFLSTSVFSYPELAPSQACALICLATRASSRSLHGSLTLSLPHGNPLFRTLTLCPARGQPRRRSDERFYVRKSGPKLQVARPGLGSAVSTASTATWQGLVGLLQRGNTLDSPALHDNTSLTSSTPF